MAPGATLRAQPPLSDGETKGLTLKVRRGDQSVVVSHGKDARVGFSLASGGYRCELRGLVFFRAPGGDCLVLTNHEPDDETEAEPMVLSNPAQVLPTLLACDWGNHRGLAQFRYWAEVEYFLGCLNKSVRELGGTLFPTSRHDPRLTDLLAFLKDTDGFATAKGGTGPDLWPSGQGRKLSSGPSKEELVSNPSSSSSSSSSSSTSTGTNEGSEIKK